MKKYDIGKSLMKFLGFNRVLCLSPHPDDVELGMFGTITKYKDTIFDVFVMTMGGARGFDDTNKYNRLDEVTEFWNTSTLKNINISSHPGYFEDKQGDSGWISFLDTIVNEQSYDCIFIPTYDDSMYEHRFVNNLAPALTRVNPISLIEYSTVSTLNNWSPNIFVDIKEHYDKKLECLKEFTTQQSKNYFKKETLDSFHTNFQCMKKGIKIVEKYKLIEVIK
jgi:LmbE family N-acetylglucosaminyl deacetylase